MRGLAEGDAEQERIPEEAKISDPDALLKNMVITDVVSAETDGGVVLACDGPQNEPGASVFSCIGDENPEGEQGALGSSDSCARRRRASRHRHRGSTRGLARRGGRRCGRGRVAVDASTGSTAVRAGARATL